MLPPRLSAYLQELITRKLLESPAFHELVHRTDAFARSMKQAAIDAVRENERPTRQAEGNSEAQKPSRPSQTWKAKPKNSARQDESESM
ncbi:hypothetical protein CROQUDRAFT_462711 [Cronartium quercuum f. sp. fusiforme G11]|uniref:Uncharacterized protein n=1 Tax=Cronartium quercuum f. sp. fusiforme G11 TaxID=708437 RepID=A0A9P6NQW0_9BASI|nr:hypothetical protein CROQUDRAFT_462711 [Cronartium quercuum f. sp. fusiforme G11]